MHKPLLALSILFNYYIAIILIVTLVIYFVVLLILADPRENKLRFYFSRTAKFIIYGLIALGISCILLIPEYNAFKLSASSDSSFPGAWTFYFDFGLMFSRHIANLDTYTAPAKGIHTLPFRRPHISRFPRY